MKIAVAQIECRLGDVAANVEKIREFSAQAKTVGAELIVFPEMTDTGYAMSAIQVHATAWDGSGAVSRIRKIAQDVSIRIVCGVSERDGARIYNSQVCVDATGEIVGKYRKAHLFTPAPIAEHKCFTAGGAPGTFNAGGLQFGLTICYDLRFPELYRKLAVDHHTNVFILSTAWPFPRFEHLRVLATARAIENQSYVIVSNRVGTDDGITFCGASAIIDPYGVVIAAASADREELLIAEVSISTLEMVRSTVPVFAHRREDLYRQPG